MAALKDKRREQFCLEYIIDLNAKLAAERAGYSVKTARTQGSKLLTRLDVAERVTELKNRRSVKCNIDAQWVLNRLIQIDSLDVIDILEEDGCVKPISQWPKEWRTSISGIDVQKMTSAGQDKAAIETVVTKIKWPDKARNLDQIGRHVNIKAWEKETDSGGAELVAALAALAGNLPV